ncbi:MAG: tRNA lysidine(34) synthetase TilS [Chloroflexi bacterium]|nr:tRNA lysidine(34) synthetase TilS [Chloroflexota bacterium]
MSVVSTLETHVAGALTRAGFSGGGRLLVVAVSGGPDSSALLFSLHRLMEQHSLKLHVAHLNHDFRGEEADEDARFVEAMAHDLGLPCTVDKQDPIEYQRQRGISSFEQTAREMRYTFLAEVAKEFGAAAVATGHTADDQAETVLLHVLRGTGLNGLRGMEFLSQWPWPGAEANLRLFRPLLGVSKADTTDYCRALSRDFRQDSGNYLHRFTRNRVRHQLLPLLAAEYNPQVSESLLRLSRTAAQTLEYMDQEVDRVWPLVALQVASQISFDLSALASLHPALQKMVLRRGYVQLVGHSRRLRESHINAMAGLVAGGESGRSLDLPGGLKLHRSYQQLVLSKDPAGDDTLPKLDGEHPVSLPDGEGQERVHMAGGWRITLRTDTSPHAPFTTAGNGGSLETEGRAGDFWSRPTGAGPAQEVSWSEWLDRASLGERLVVRTRRPGDRFQPLGMAREKKLQDFFTDAKVPRVWRDHVPLLVSDRGIAWVVGCRIADWAKMTPGDSASSPAVLVRFEAEI